MDLKVISELIKMMSDSKLSSLEVESRDLRIKMEKNLSPDGEGYSLLKKDNSGRRLYESENAKTEPAIANKVIEEYTESSVEKAIDSSVNDNLLVVKSPIVGTFYLAPSPTSEPFATVGKKVKMGDTLCIIEAMKLMNEIESEFDGEIVEILVENGSMVEFGQPLFKLK